MSMGAVSPVGLVDPGSQKNPTAMLGARPSTWQALMTPPAEIQGVGIFTHSRSSASSALFGEGRGANAEETTK